MSISYYSYLVAGVPCSEVLETRIEKTTETKYNPDAGVPYQKQVTTTRTFLGSLEIRSNSDDLYDFLETSGLERFGKNAEDSNGILGVLVKKTEYAKGSQQITVEEVLAKKAEAEEKLKASGINHPVSLHLILYAG